MMKPNIKLLLVALLFVVIAIAVSLGVATHGEGETARFALWAFFAIIVGSSLFGFVVTAIVIVRAMRGGFGIPKSAKDWNRFAKAMMWLCGVFILLGMVFAVRTALFLGTAQPTTGTIVELIERKSDDGDILFAPVYTFVDTTGRTNRVISSSASYPPVGLVGDQIPVLFNPKNPSRAELDRFFDLWGFTAIGGGLGILYLVVFWIVAAVSKRKMRNAQPGESTVPPKAAPSASSDVR
jgi:hypothetical protein